MPITSTLVASVFADNKYNLFSSVPINCCVVHLLQKLITFSLYTDICLVPSLLTPDNF